MHAVLLTIHALIVLTLIGVVLLQRSDGGALGLGGGGGGGFMTSRGAANVLTRTTSVLAALFFATSILLAITAGGAERDADIIEELTGETIRDPNTPLSTRDLLETLGSGQEPAIAPEEAAPEAGLQLEAAPAPEAAEAAPAESESGETTDQPPQP